MRAEATARLRVGVRQRVAWWPERHSVDQPFQQTRWNCAPSFYKSTHRELYGTERAAGAERAGYLSNAAGCLSNAARAHSSASWHWQTLPSRLALSLPAARSTQHPRPAPRSLTPRIGSHSALSSVPRSHSPLPRCEPTQPPPRGGTVCLIWHHLAAGPANSLRAR